MAEAEVKMIGGGRAKAALKDYSLVFSGPLVKDVYLTAAIKVQKSIQSQARWKSAKAAISVGVFPDRHGKIASAFVSMLAARFALYWVWWLLHGTDDRYQKARKKYVGKLQPDDFWNRGVRAVRPIVRRDVIEGLRAVAQRAAVDTRARIPSLF